VVLYGPEVQQKDVWKAFYEAVDIKGNKAVVICKKCSKIYDHPRLKLDSSTSTLNKHINKHHRQSNPAQTSVGAMDNFIKPRFSKETITKIELEQLLLETTAVCNWPFFIFDNKHFQHFLQRAFSDHNPPGRKQMKNLLEKAADTARNEIRSRFAFSSSRISLALDFWASSNSYNFMGMFSII
jgi:hypothetical protein